MKCEQCGGELTTEFIKDYYGETWQKRCASCDHVQDKQWYHSGYWDTDFDDGYADEMEELEIAMQDCGMNKQQDFCKWLGSNDCDRCPFQHNLFDKEQDR